MEAEGKSENLSADDALILAQVIKEVTAGVNPFSEKQSFSRLLVYEQKAAKGKERLPMDRNKAMFDVAVQFTNRLLRLGKGTDDIVRDFALIGKTNGINVFSEMERIYSEGAEHEERNPYKAEYGRGDWYRAEAAKWHTWNERSKELAERK